MCRRRPAGSAPCWLRSARTSCAARWVRGDLFARHSDQAESRAARGLIALPRSSAGRVRRGARAVSSPVRSCLASSRSGGSRTSATDRRLDQDTARHRTNFRSQYIAPNLARYPRWLTETHTSVHLAVGCGRRSGSRGARRSRFSHGRLSRSRSRTGSRICPIVYFQPNEWFYTRFLLPAIRDHVVLRERDRALAGSPRFPRRGTPLWRWCCRRPRRDARPCTRRQARRFDIRNQERKYPLAGAFVRERLPRDAFVLAGQHSGSIRYYANRPTLRWDLLSPTRTRQVTRDISRAGLRAVPGR